MPRARRGTNPPLVVALLAPSGAATPWMAPFPNCSVFLETLCSRS